MSNPDTIEKDGVTYIKKSQYDDLYDVFVMCYNKLVRLDNTFTRVFELDQTGVSMFLDSVSNYVEDD